MFENRALRRILGPKRDEVIGKWRKLHKEEFNDLYFSPNTVGVIKSRMRWAGHVAHMRDRRGLYMVLVGKPEGKRPFGRSRHRWEDNIKTDFFILFFICAIFKLYIYIPTNCTQLSAISWNIDI